MSFSTSKKEAEIGDTDRLSFPNSVLIADLREQPHSIFLSLQNQIQFSLHIFLSNLDIIHLRYALNLLTAQVDK